MCCAFLALVLLGPRIVGAFRWLFKPGRWKLAFNNWGGGTLWWIRPRIGQIFIPWTTIMYILVAPGGVVGWDWLWLGLMLAADIAFYAGGYDRKSIPAYEEY